MPAAENSLPRTSRLLRRADFLRVQRRPTLRLKGRCLVVLATAREHDGPTRLGIIASKKVGNAVMRNRAKRLIREAFRKNKGLFPVGLDLVVIPFDRAAHATARDVEADIVEQSRQLQRRKAALAASAPRYQAPPRVKPSDA